MLDNFEKHLTFYCLKNATLLAVGAGFDDSFLAFLLLYSFNSLEDPVWSMASTNIATSDVPSTNGCSTKSLENCAKPCAITSALQKHHPLVLTNWL